jgi:hypothetical protein
MSTKEKQTRFFAASAAYILGEKTGMTIKGDPDRIDATRDVLQASRRLYEALHDDSKGLTMVLKLVNEKKHYASEFHKQTGIEWIL